MYRELSAYGSAKTLASDPVGALGGIVIDDAEGQSPAMSENGIRWHGHKSSVKVYG